MGLPTVHGLLILRYPRVVLHRSVYGRWLYAVGKNEEAARYSGINTNRVIVASYMICGGLAGRRGLVRDVHELGLADPPMAISMNSTRSRLPSWAAAGCAAARAQSRYRAGTRAAAGAAEPREYPGHSQLTEFRGDGHGHSDRRVGGSAIAGTTAPKAGAGRPARAAPKSTSPEQVQGAAPRAADPLPARTGDLA